MRVVGELAWCSDMTDPYAESVVILTLLEDDLGCRELGLPSEDSDPTLPMVFGDSLYALSREWLLGAGLEVLIMRSVGSNLYARRAEPPEDEPGS